MLGRCEGWLGGVGCILCAWRGAQGAEGAARLPFQRSTHDAHPAPAASHTHALSSHTQHTHTPQVKVLRCIKPVQGHNVVLGQCSGGGGEPGYTGAGWCVMGRLCLPAILVLPSRATGPGPPRLTPSLTPIPHAHPLARRPPQTTPRCQRAAARPPLPPSLCSSTTTGGRCVRCARCARCRVAAVEGGWGRPAAGSRAALLGRCRWARLQPVPCLAPPPPASPQVGGRALCTQGRQGAERPQGGDPGAAAPHPALCVWRRPRHAAQRGTAGCCWGSVAGSRVCVCCCLLAGSTTRALPAVQLARRRAVCCPIRRHAPISALCSWWCGCSRTRQFT